MVHLRQGVIVVDKSMGERLRRLRRDKHLTQDEMAGQLNTRFGMKADRFVISKWETGAQEPQLATVSVLARFFGTTIDYINSGKEIIVEHDFGTYELDDVEKVIIETYRKADGKQKLRIGVLISEISDEIEKNNLIPNGNGACG